MVGAPPTPRTRLRGPPRTRLVRPTRRRTPHRHQPTRHQSLRHLQRRPTIRRAGQALGIPHHRPSRRHRTSPPGRRPHPDRAIRTRPRQTPTRRLDRPRPPRAPRRPDPHRHHAGIPRRQHPSPQLPRLLQPIPPPPGEPKPSTPPTANAATPGPADNSSPGTSPPPSRSASARKATDSPTPTSPPTTKTSRSSSTRAHPEMPRMRRGRERPAASGAPTRAGNARRGRRAILQSQRSAITLDESQQAPPKARCRHIRLPHQWVSKEVGTTQGARGSEHRPMLIAVMAYHVPHREYCGT